MDPRLFPLKHACAWSGRNAFARKGALRLDRRNRLRRSVLAGFGSWYRALPHWILLLGSTRVLVEGESMWPLLRDGDRLLVSRLAYRLSPPHRGDIVLLRDPCRPGYECIKRIVALPGERIDAAGLPVAADTQDAAPGPWRTLGSGQFFVLGDNRAFSRDSRSFGPVHRSDLLGWAWRRYGRGSSPSTGD